MAKKGKKVKLLKGEKMMYTLLLVLIVAIPLFNVYTSSLLSETNNEVETMKEKILKDKSLLIKGYQCKLMSLLV